MLSKKNICFGGCITKVMNVIWLGFYIVIFPIFMGVLLEWGCKLELGLKVRYWWEGFLIEVLLFGLVHKSLMVLQMDFIQICNIYIIVSIFLTVCMLTLSINVLVNIRKVKKRVTVSIQEWREWALLGIFLLLLLIQITKSGTILEAYPEDHMAIQVSTIVSDSSLFKSNPFTGMLYEVGQARMEYSSLTVLYAFFVNIFHTNTVATIYQLIPIWFLCLFYSMQYSIGMELFRNNKKKAFLYCSAVAVAIIFGTTKKWMLSSYLLLYPWVEETIWVCFVLPVSVWMLIKLLFLKKEKRTIYLLLVSTFLLMLEQENFFYIISILVIGIVLFIALRMRAYD